MKCTCHAKRKLLKSGGGCEIMIDEIFASKNTCWYSLTVSVVAWIAFSQYLLFPELCFQRYSYQFQNVYIYIYNYIHDHASIYIQQSIHPWIHIGFSISFILITNCRLPPHSFRFCNFTQMQPRWNSQGHLYWLWCHICNISLQRREKIKPGSRDCYLVMH